MKPENEQMFLVLYVDGLEIVRQLKILPNDSVIQNYGNTWSQLVQGQESRALNIQTIGGSGWDDLRKKCLLSDRLLVRRNL